MFRKDEKNKKAFVEVLVANSQSIARAMLDDGSIDENKYLEVLMEHLYLFLHIADRLAYSIITEKRRVTLLPGIFDLSIRFAVETTCGHWPDDLKTNIYNECINNLYSSFNEFAQYKSFLGETEIGPKNTLLWEFCKNIARIRGEENNVGSIIGHGWVVGIALKNIEIRSHLEELK